MNNRISDTAEYPLPSAEPPARPFAVRAEVAARSHPGLVRSNNEDVYLVSHYGRFWQTLSTNLPPGEAPERADTDGYGLLVADGVGGHAAGEVASRLAVNTLVQIVLDFPDWILLLPGDVEWKRMQDRAHDIYRQIDAAIRAESEERPELAGMGTTLTVARNVGRDLVVAHVGDSRAYRLRGKTFCQLTRDHTLAQEMADARGIAPGDVVRHLFRHVLTRAVGGKVVWSGADVNKFDLADGDQVLLCSDGLTDLVPGPMISSVLQTAASAESACDELVSLALSAGGSDNVTCVLARFNLHADEPS